MKPTNIDAQRILAILQELKERLTYMSVVTPQVLEGLQSDEGSNVRELLGPETFKLFVDQIMLEENYVLSHTQQDQGSEAAENGGGGAEPEGEARELLDRLSKNSVDLCRKLKTTNVITELRNFQETRPQQVLQLIRTLADMEELTLKRLATTVEEERSRQELIEHYKSREEASLKKKAQLEKDLAAVRKDREKAQASRTEVLTKLKADLLDVKDSADHKSRALKDKYNGRMRELQEKYQKKEEQYTADIQKLRDQVRSLGSSSQEDEVGLRRKKKRFETDIEELVQNYDSVFRAAHEEYETSLVELRKEQKELSELEDHFRKLDSEIRRNEMETEMESLRDKLVEEEKERQAEAASVLQGFWKGMTGRLEYQQLKKMKKGKKGKKGKK
ncbi:unnamed protein product [Amoebophrya sp. A120]|nr:unnamed protein product [Amoebophrya sp. A120]|eukprot:GSA120T00009268001.1